MNKTFAKQVFEEWGFWPICGGVDEPPIVEPPPVIDPPVIEPPPVSTPVIGLETKLDGDQIPEELRGKSLSEVIGMLQQPTLPQIPEPVQPSSQEPTEQETLEELRVNFYQDPIGTVSKLVQMAIAPVVNSIYQDKEDKGRNSIVSRDNYDMLKKDVDEFMTNVPQHLRANPQSWDIAYNYAKGKNFEKLTKQVSSAPAELPPPTGILSVGGKVNLTEDEKRAALNMGITEEDYIKWK